VPPAPCSPPGPTAWPLTDAGTARLDALVSALPDGADVAAMRRGSTAIVGVDPLEVVAASGLDGLAALDRLSPGCWAGFLAFELGHAIEHVDVRGASLEPSPVADVTFVRFGAWATVHPDGSVTTSGSTTGRRLLGQAIEAPPGSPRVAREPRAPWDGGAEPPTFTSSLDRAGHAELVADVHRLLVDGECYQVNLTRRLEHDGALDVTALYRALLRSDPAPHAALLRLELEGAAVGIASASPERFLRWRGPELETRPIKGTARDATSLSASAKDRAEHVMIVDLARNDLGRVCVPGSIHVPSLCGTEPRPGLHHLVSTVRGRRRDNVGLRELVAATFPPASVTGAPKPRVLQAIEDLEPVRRGVYCGALGWIDTEQDEGDLAVAIRTFVVAAGHTTLGVGGGVVIDSTAAGEWDETELKARHLLAVTHGPAAADPVRAASELRRRDVA
jgi:para-aminobenzoate synthetase component 1